MEKRDKGLVVLLLCLPLVLTLVFLGNSLDIFSVHSFNLLTGAAITGGSSTTILPDDPRIIDDSALNQSLPEDSSQPDHNSASEQNVGIAPTESSNPSSIGIQAEATSTSCGTVSSSLTLTSDVSNDTTCFTINANDLTLDCNGFTAHYGATGTGYGVNNTNGYDNITIRNCNLKKNGTSGSTNYGVYFTSSDNSTIYNSTIYTNGSSSNYGIFINFSVSLNISRNYISTNGTTTNYGIRFTQVNYTIINNNTIRTSGTSSQNEGVSLSTAVYNNFTNNDILTSGSSLNYGVASSTGNTGNNRYLWNNIVAAGTSSGDAFRLSASSNYFEGNIISSIASSSGYGLNLLGSGSANNVFLNNNFSSASSNSVIDNTGASSYNQIIYNNSYGQVVWNLTDLDCNLNNLKADNSTIFLSDNAIGILSSGGTSNKLLGVSTIEVRSLNYNTTPYLLRDGSRCDNTNNCNISYNNNTGLLSANVTVTGLFQALNSSAINYCQTITNTTTLVESVSSPSGCFVMNTSNVTLDCSGYSINYGGIGIGSAISAEYVGNITIKNCIITNTLIPITTDTAAIKFNGIDNSLIDNNTITLISNQSNYGVYTYGLSENITISNNTISNNGNDSDYVIYITNTMRNIQLLKNNLTRIYGKTNPYAVFFDNVEENTIHGNNINIIGTNNTVGGYGIYVTDRLNNITSNNITVSSSVGSYGIIVSNNGLYEISNMNISHNIVNINGSNSSSGIYLYYVTYNNSMAGNKVNFTSAGTNNAGIMMAIIDGLNFTNNSIYFGQRINNSEALNITTGNDLKIQNTLISMTNYSNIAIVIGSQTDDITITDTNVYNAFTLLKTSNSNNNVFINMNSSGSNDSSLYADSCSYADACVTTFINSSLGDYYSIDSTNLIYVKWYVNVNVSNATGEPVSLVNVTGYNVINNLDDTNLTDSNGLTRLELTEYYLLDNVKYYTSGNHTIKAFLANYTLGTGEINLINHSGGLVNITINKFSCGNNISSDLTFGQDLTCISTPLLSVNSSNITIDGDNFLITGNQTYYGINIEGKTGVTVKELRLRNFTRGINLFFSNYSQFRSVNISNSTISVFFNTSTNNTFYDSTISNGSQAAVYATSTSNTINCFINSTIDLNNVTIEGNAQVCRGWYARVNVTFNNSLALPYVDVYAYFNDTGELDAHAVTDATGIVTLDLTDQIKNASGIFNRSVHNITVNFTGISGTVTNSTITNITSNVILNLSLNPNCTVPYDNLAITNNTILCPGNYLINDNYSYAQDQTYGVIRMTTDSVNLTCDRTNITKNNYFYGWGIYAVNRKNITINGCSIGGYLNNIYFNDVNDSIIYNSTIYGTGNGIYLSKSNRNNISHSEFIADLTFKMYSNNNSVYNSTFNGAGIHFIDSSQSGFNWINTPPSGNLFYFNTFVDFSNYVTRFDYLGINNILNNFNTTINGVNVGNSWEYICSGNLDFTDSDNNGWYDSGSDYPYNLSIHNSNALGLDYYPKVITCESEVFLGSSSSSSSTTTTSNPSAPPAPAAAPSTAVAAPAAVSASAPPNSFTAGEAGAYQFNPSLDLSQYTDLITKLADYGYTPEEFIQQAIRILILDQQDFSLAYKQIYSLLGTFGKGKLSKFSGITILDSFSALAFSIENKQLDLDAGETIDLDFTFDIPGITPVKLPATVTFEGKDIKDVEMNVQPKSDSGVFIKIDQEKDLGEIIIVIAPDGDSSTINEYAIEFSFIKKEEQDNLFAKVKSRLLGEETHAADYIDGIKVKGNEGGLYGFDFKYDSSSMSGKYLFTSTILEGTTVIAQNTYDLELE